MQNITQSPDSSAPVNPLQSDKRSSLFWGLVLVAAGFFFLVQQIGILSFLPNLVWTLLIGVGAIGFLYVFLSKPRQNWWAAIPGSVLMGVSGIILIEQLDIAGLDKLSGPLILGSIAVGFALVFLTNPEFWWALIPAGVMTTLAMVAYVSELAPSIDEGSILFLGFGLTFAAIGFLPSPNGSRRWAFIPAAVMFGIALLTMISMDDYAAYLWPLVMIGAGVVVLWRSLNR